MPVAIDDGCYNSLRVLNKSIKIFFKSLTRYSCSAALLWLGILQRARLLNRWLDTKKTSNSAKFYCLYLYLAPLWAGTCLCQDSNHSAHWHTCTCSLKSMLVWIIVYGSRQLEQGKTSMYREDADLILNLLLPLFLSVQSLHPLLTEGEHCRP